MFSIVVNVFAAVCCVLFIWFAVALILHCLQERLYLPALLGLVIAGLAALAFYLDVRTLFHD